MQGYVNHESEFLCASLTRHVDLFQVLHVLWMEKVEHGHTNHVLRQVAKMRHRLRVNVDQLAGRRVAH